MPAPTFLSAQVTAASRVVLDMQRRRRPGLVVASAGWERCARDYRVVRPGFPWLAVELVVEGGGVLELAGRRHRLVSGSLYAYGPGVAHAIAADPSAPPLKYFLDLAGDDAAGLLAGIGLAPGRLASLPVHAEVRALLDVLIAAGRRGQTAACAALARAAVLLAGAGMVEPGRASGALAAYVRCRDWLERHGGDSAGLSEAAAACAVSEAYLCRLFRRFDRTSPWRQERLRRLQRAADALLASARPVADIGRSAGYADPFHFSRAFRSAFGISPLGYRRLRGGAAAEHPGP